MKHSIPESIMSESARRDYRRYGSKRKSSHLLTHKFDNNMGFVQPLIKTTHLTKSKDYSTINKKLVSDYSIELVDISQNSIVRAKYRLDPSRLLSYRKQQNSLKSNTKINIHQHLHLNLTVSNVGKRVDTSESKLVEGGFHKQDYSLKRRQKSLSVRYRHQKQLASRQLTQTLSKSIQLGSLLPDQHSVKYQRTQKLRSSSQKQPKRVSGDQIRNGTRMANMQKDNQKNEEVAQWKNKRRFRQIIIKMKEYNRIFDGSISETEVNQKIARQMTQQEDMMNQENINERKLMDKIQQFAKGERLDIIERDYQHLYELQDLQRVNPKFYEELIRNRRKKMDLLQLDLKRLQKVSPFKKLQIQPQLSIKFQQDNDSAEESQREQQYFSNTQWLQQQSSRKKYYNSMPKIDKLALFLSSFLRVSFSATLFGIPIDMVYHAMLENPLPYSLQGSFLFFKAVLSNDLETVKVFVEQFPKVAHQIDDMGRSALVASTEMNFMEVSTYLIEVGVNLDIEAINGATAVSNCLKNRNRELLLLLLEKGASPWSRKIELPRLVKNQETARLLKISRKMHLAMSLQRRRDRVQMWGLMKSQFRIPHATQTNNSILIQHPKLN